MDEIREPMPPCPICGEALNLVSTADPDETGFGRAEFRCAKGHRITVELVETDEDHDHA